MGGLRTWVYDAPNKQFCTGLNVTNQKDKGFLYIDLPNYLDDLVTNVRNLSRHPARVDKRELLTMGE